MTGSSGNARQSTRLGSLAQTACATMLPSPPKGACSSAVTMSFLPAAARRRPSVSRGLTQYMSSAPVEMPCSFSSFAASWMGFTISPQATSSTSVPSHSTVARFIAKGTWPSSYTSSTGLRPRRM